MECNTVIGTTYKELLKVEDVATRVQLQPVYCMLRDYIARTNNLNSQEVQETFEHLALSEKNR